MSSKLTAIVLVNFNGASDTIECIKSINSNLKGSFKVIIVDNASTDSSCTVLKEFLENNTFSFELKLIEAKHNNGFSSGNNIGILKAKEAWTPDYYWLLNNDTTVDEESLIQLIRVKNQVPKSGIIGSKLLFFDAPTIVQARGGKIKKWIGKFVQIGYNSPSIQEENNREIVDYVIGASLFIGQDFIDTVGLMSEDYFLFYEEVDWALRAKKQGLNCINCNESIVYHKQGRSTGNHSKQRRNPKMMYYQFKNLILLYRKFYPGLFLVPISVIVYRCLKLGFKEDVIFFRLMLEVLFKKRKKSFNEC